MKKLFFLLAAAIGLGLMFPVTGEAAEQRILLVYDSLNLANSGEQNVDSLQRLITSMGVKVDTVEDKDYLETTLRDDVYTGVISFSNWSEKGLQSVAFKKDRAAFSGSRLHIGLMMDEDEKAQFAGTFKQLSHRQYTLVHQDDIYEQQLDYQDQSLLLETEEGKTFGMLETQELDKKTYPFGVIQNKEAFLPMYSNRGALFLQSAELISEWLGKSSSYRPMLTFKGLSPLNDMSVANDFIDKINKSAVYYTLSTTSAYQNNDLLVYTAFTDLLDKAQGAGLIFLSVPAVNSANVSDGRILQSIMEETISLMVSRNLFPVGLSAPGYWNQDVQYRADSLNYGKTIILEENPSIDTMYYRTQDNRGAVYDTSFYSLNADYLDSVKWNMQADNDEYEFPMPVSIAYDFPEDKETEKDVLKRLAESAFSFNQAYDEQYTFQVVTQTQDIEYLDGRLVLNGRTVNQFVAEEQTKLPSEQYQGLFANSFRRINAGLVWFIAAALLVLTVLFVRGNQNYRSKYVNRGGRRK